LVLHLPKIPSERRIKFCLACAKEMDWVAKRCPECGAAQIVESTVLEVPGVPSQPVEACEWDYRVYPFIGELKENESVDRVRAQLQGVIDDHARRGWEFYSMGNVNIRVLPGCLGALFGARADYMRYDQLIFRRRRRE
jgi:hypothetical protein